MNRKGKAMWKRVKSLAFGLMVFAATDAAFAAIQYNIIDLGGSMGTVRAFGLNDHGVVVGYQQTGTLFEGFRWTAETGMVELGRVILRDVNNAGVAVGQAIPFFPDSPYAVRALVDGTVETIGGPTSNALGINASGAIAGSSQSPWPPYGFVWREGEATQIATVPPQSAQLNAINDAGVAAGGFNTSAATWTEASGWTVLPAVWGSQRFAYGISNTGWIVGTAFSGVGTSQGIVWRPDGSGIAVGGIGEVLSSTLARINDTGVAVGYAETRVGGGDPRAIRWTEDLGLQDLNSLIDPASGWILREASDINAKGQIVGWGTVLGAERAFLLDPISAAPPPPPPGGVIPEPATSAMLIAGFGLVGALLRRRREAAA